MEFQDKTIVCKDCGKDFIFTASEQQFYADKGFQNEPSRCADDRAKHRSERQNRPKTEVTCANCGQLTTVPFEPKGDRPVYCLDCFKQFKAEGKLPAAPASPNQGEPADKGASTETSAPEASEEPEVVAEAEEPKEAEAEGEEPKAEKAEEAKAEAEESTDDKSEDMS